MRAISGISIRGANGTEPGVSSLPKRGELQAAEALYPLRVASKTRATSWYMRGRVAEDLAGPASVPLAISFADRVDVRPADQRFVP